MGRWEPNAQERLTRAALELFAERGYDSTTVAEIADRAGLTKRTFFRHFADKREVLFRGEEVLSRLISDGIAGAPASATPLHAVGAGLEAAATAFGPERREWSRQRQAVIADNRELRERELLKSTALTAAMADALRERGVPDLTADLAAEIGYLAFRTSYARWIEPADEQDFAELTRRTLKELREALGAVG
ncbi:TetR/AcrR family transcriptional regulator [Amycolatopsis thermalba]|uniref:TetR/AcrR family transcriptional regulator n=1 Tax=Amycolatopsis thermalba TaxID=944492 RepID=A0ABY4NN14_9PSEU|nr:MULTISPECIES: TetR/AcrR family transcriptional regulator [Amycolatopsis]UQS21837.1 TetR/AcrR family transcriptional regulator [Amycolatopsis thermalba]